MLAVCHLRSQLFELIALQRQLLEGLLEVLSIDAQQRLCSRDDAGVERE